MVCWVLERAIYHLVRCNVCISRGGKNTNQLTPYMYTRTHGGAGSSAHANYSNILTYISSGSRDLYTARGSHDQQQMTAQTSSKNTQSRNREHPVRELVGVVSRPQLANQIISMWAGLQSHKPRG